MLHNPVFWVTVAFVLFVALAYKKVAALAAGALDSRAAKIKAELDEARRLREEAQEVLNQYKRKQAEALKEAQEILEAAKRDSDALRAQAQSDLKAALDARTKHAMERIAQEEQKAVADVRNHVVDISLAAARALIADHVGQLSQEELVKLALSDIDRKLH